MIKCTLCHQPPTTEGYDPCLGYLAGAQEVCCGHGVAPGYVVWRPFSSSKETQRRRGAKLLVEEESFPTFTLGPTLSKPILLNKWLKRLGLTYPIQAILHAGIRLSSPQKWEKEQ